MLTIIDRHMTRHRQKDAEGSELMTRKRAWKDSEGRIVKKRPAIDSVNNTLTLEASQRTTATPSLPISPPRSASSHLTASPKQQFDPAPDFLDDLQDLNVETNTIQTYAPGDTEDQDLFWEGLPFLNDSGNGTGPFDDIFMPDTASSFNMPYTTMTNYNWLFDLSMNTDIHANSLLSTAQNEQDTTAHQRDNSEQVENETRQQGGDVGLQGSQVGVCEKNTSRSQRQGSRTLPQEAPMCLLDPRRRLPALDDVTRRSVVDVIELCRPAFPDGVFPDLLLLAI